MNICDFCFDEPKFDRCNHDCHDDHCHHRKMRGIVRITTKCTQSCNHCCFECSPSRTDFMTEDIAVKINQFFQFNRIDSMNIMGGEIICHPQYDQIIPILTTNMPIIRLTTNGDWSRTKITATRFMQLCQLLASKGKLCVAISKDQFHTNKYVKKAQTYCQTAKIECMVNNEPIENAIVPVGRGYGQECCHSMLSCYCKQETRLYSFFVNEYGQIGVCPMGIWLYDSVDDYQNQSFANRFQSVKKTFFFKIFSCTDCVRMYHQFGVKLETELIVK